jgi:hypothetical protein
MQILRAELKAGDEISMSGVQTAFIVLNCIKKNAWCFLQFVRKIRK